MSKMIRLFAAVLVLKTASSLAQSPLAELYSPLVSSKIAALANSPPPNPSQYPENTDQLGKSWQYFPADGWTSAFLPATLYAMYDRTKLCPSEQSSFDWVSMGRAWSTNLVPLETRNSVGHDVGFLSFPFSYELAIDSTNQTAINAVNSFATDLAARFNPIVGCTRSWDTPADPTNFQVIIDNMMNLEVLFASAQLTGNQTLVNIAISHADTTMKNHLRPDGSSFHVVEYNSTTGAVVKKMTAQGYADNSTWTRGQSWGIYGFANMYKHTLQVRYIDTARKMASLYVSRIPSSGIVPWDFDAPQPAPADTSSSTIAAAALLLLSQLESSISNSTGAKYWADAAKTILANNIQFGWQPSWMSLLSNGTINKPGNNFDTGIIYGDYYFVVAGNELVSMGLASC